MGGTVPRGYVVRNKRLVLGQADDVALVRRIFSLFVDGFSPWAIAEKLDADGVPTLKGTPWVATSIYRILKNEAYAGTYHHGEVVIPNNHSAIISPATFTAAQDRLACRRPSRSPQHKRGYLLTGLIYCGDCGCRMHGKRNGSCHTYICDGYHRNRGLCRRNTVSEDEVLGHIVGTIQEKLLDPKNVNRLRKELHQQVKTSDGKGNADSIRKEIKAVESKLGKAKRRLVKVDADMLPLVQEQLRELQDQQDCLQADLKAAATPRNRLISNCDQMIEKALGGVTRLQDVVRNGDRELVRDCLNEAVHRVDLWTVQEKRGTRHFYHLQRGAIELSQQNAAP